MFRTLSTLRIAAAACLLIPLWADAAGLGRLTVQSALGQPLRAEVEVVSVQSGEHESLNARIASPDAFRAAGIEFSPAMTNLRVAVERRDGRSVVRLSSTQSINEPFIELLLELQWSNGRLVREYTFLLDPVEYKAPAPVVAAPTPAPIPAAKPAPAAPVAKPAPAAVRTAGTYEIKRGDTLSKVARESKSGDVTVNQMLVALFKANQQAFMRNNMFLMRSGQILKIPEQGAATAIDPKEATRLVKEHSVEFEEYRRGLGASVAAAPAKPAPAPEREAPGRIAPKPPEQAPKEQKDQIKLSKVEPGKPGAPATRAAVGDDKVALNRALQESQSRVTDLEKQIADLKKLIELKNQQLALLEQKAGGKPAAAQAPVPAAPKPAAEPAKPAPEPAKPAAAPATPAAEAPKPAAEAPKPAAEAPKPVPQPAAPPAQKAPPVAAKAKPAAAPPPEPSLVDEFLDNPVALGGLGAVLVLLIGYGAWAWRRKKAAQSQEGGFSAVAAGSAAAVAAPTAAEPLMPGAAAVSSPVAEAAPVMEEVDPIAEADVYLAYGRDAQAEAILKDALASDPDRVVVHAKLLDIYAQRKDRTAFEQSALKIKSLSGGAGPDWEKAMSLGRSIDPENGLYGTGPAPAGETVTAPGGAASPTLDFDLGSTTSPGTPTAPAASAVLDFDIGATTTERPAPQFTPGDTVVLDASQMEAAKAQTQFDIGTVSPKAAPPKAETPPPAAAPAPAAVPEPAGLDFDLDFDLGESKPKAAPPPAAPPSADLSTISLELGTSGTAAPEAAVDPKWQEVATKLDLAKAYQEMGDKNGARELLDEVLKEGDAAQQEEAKRILAKLA